MISDCKTLTIHPSVKGQAITSYNQRKNRPKHNPPRIQRPQPSRTPTWTGYLASIFRHTVEFSKSGRTRATPLGACSEATSLPYRHSPARSRLDITSPFQADLRGFQPIQGDPTRRPSHSLDLGSRTRHRPPFRVRSCRAVQRVELYGGAETESNPGRHRPSSGMIAPSSCLVAI